MNSQVRFRMTRHAFIAAVVAAAFPINSIAAAGRVEFVIGTASAIGSDGRERTLTKGDEVNKGDTLQTVDGRLQARFSDGGYISLQPNTEFKVIDYNFNGKADGSERGFFSLVKGGLRAITGSIGHKNRQTYLVNTPVATIGIRGTEFLAQYDTKLLVKVGNGAVYLSNPAGDIILYKGQVGEVSGSGGKPQQSSDEPSVNAAAPAGGTPDKTKQEQDAEKSTQYGYIDGNVRIDNEEERGLCQTSASCAGGSSEINLLAGKTLADIPSLNSMGVVGGYSATTVLNMTTGAGSTYSGTGSIVMAVDFSDYSVTVGLSNVTFASGSFGAGSSSALNGTVTTSLNSSTGAIFTASGSATISGGFTGSGSMIVDTGSTLNPTNLSTATINYNVNVSGYQNAGGNVTANLNGYGAVP